MYGKKKVDRQNKTKQTKTNKSRQAVRQAGRHTHTHTRQTCVSKKKKQAGRHVRKKKVGRQNKTKQYKTKQKQTKAGRQAGKQAGGWTDLHTTQHDHTRHDTTTPPRPPRLTKGLFCKDVHERF